jgi:tryptophan-rich sensory protein
MSWLALVGWILVSFAAAAIGGVAGPGAWYAGIVKPSWNPPNWVFGPVWTVLYAMMGVAAWLVWLRRPQVPVGPALALFGVQLLLNAFWSWLFFGWHRMGWALLEMGLLWLAILATLIAFRRVAPAAGYLLVPYLAWVSFAWFLNYTLWRLNR